MTGNDVGRSVPAGRGGAVRRPALCPPPAPPRLPEEGAEAEGVRQLRRVSRLRGPRGQDTAQTGQESLVLHQELPCPRQAGEELQSAQAEVVLLQTALALLTSGRIQRTGGLEGVAEMYGVPQQVVQQGPQSAQEDVQVVTERLSVTRASPARQGVPPGLAEEAGEEVRVQRAHGLGLHHVQQLHQRHPAQAGQGTVLRDGGQREAQTLTHFIRLRQQGTTLTSSYSFIPIFIFRLVA